MEWVPAPIAWADLDETSGARSIVLISDGTILQFVESGGSVSSEAGPATGVADNDCRAGRYVVLQGVP